MLFAIVDVLPGSALVLPAFVVLVFAFLATSADSIAYATAMVTSSKDDPPPRLRAFWATLMGIVAALLLRMGEGGIKALQSFIVITAAPVSLVMAATLPALWLTLRRGSREEGRGSPRARATTATSVSSGTSESR